MLPEILRYVTYVILGLFVLVLLFAFTRKKIYVSGYRYGFDGQHISAEEFFTIVKERLNAREISGVLFKEATHFGDGLLSEQRKYLQIVRNEYVFEIGAGPLGTCYYVSWRLFETEYRFVTVLKKVPLIRIIMDYKTFHHLDSEGMYQDIMSRCFQEAIEQVTNIQGIRQSIFQPEENTGSSKHTFIEEAKARYSEKKQSS